ncbi:MULTISPECIES: anaerobic ribonucleoside-triphosphate reductase activating protein [unclassified Campylobacter]|uniref:anaerobic ribonucleoside-triphosphate reductase activating protein n=1 Tax=unclassified Campylobacter TaxID=2593542 RepID=UPI0022E9B30D|nr:MULTISPECIES: anaerobic ribonucleoside-triphosphate reductase activating protein [unclassified Campylobacter]MDA3043366.1 anaerobic ribonucleoside-triphosphate reductase activating protein [Campylobacter sp. JMF_09 ED2]MDA3045119.1 anaerobic ribonucleoside-triphosphate reductase activating protein [Campylobacter sp. JMF_07 ED4]MDA3064281.1 anaerobic ribonucleoside-triphosphate reductase activating protein [Campylobacter sp. JMF_11 EL3]MDA3072419.1 anaerobic ribonucleoside-triphosphate reduct
MQNSEIYHITPFTMTDFPERLSAIVWFAGCNMRCRYCYNPSVVRGEGKISEDELFAFLRSRVGKLEAVVFSGGECTCARGFMQILQKTKNLGFEVKIDTNGSNPQIIQNAVNLGLVDFISLDFKAHEAKFSFITKSNFYENFLQTLKFLLSANFVFEVRTTVHSDLLSESDISQMAQILHEQGYRGEYFLQNFLDTGENLGDLGAPKQNFDPSKIISPLKISLRNF